MACRFGRWLSCAGLACLLLLSACASQPLLSGVQASPATITPNGDQTGALTAIRYQLGEPAAVSIYLIDSTGRQYPFRLAERRSPGAYAAPFAGAVKTDPDQIAQSVLPDGVYTYVVSAETPAGQKADAKGTLTIQGADPQPLQVSDLVAYPNRITPNGDARDDKTVISYRLNKDAEVEIFATDAAGVRYLIEPATQRFAGLLSREWNGFGGGILAANGEYQVHVVARDRSGNVADSLVPVTIAEGGTPDLQVLDVEFTPPTVPLSGTLQVKIKVKNTGDTPIFTKGPPPGTNFPTDTNYFAFTDASGRPKYFDEAGRWRAVVSWDQSGRQYPARWALTQPVIGPNGQEDYPPLRPGEESTITGTIQIKIPEIDELHFWASYEKGAIGFGPQVGQQRIGVSR